MTGPAGPDSDGRRGVLAHLTGMAGGEAAARIAQIAALAVAGRVLGPEGVGVIALAAAFATLAQPLIQGGPELTGIRLLSECASGDRGAVVRTISRLKIRLSLTILPFCAAVAMLSGHHRPSDLAQIGLQCLGAAMAAAGYGWALRALHRPLQQAALRGLQSLGGLALACLLLRTWPSPLALPLADILAGAAVAGLGLARVSGLLSGSPPCEGGKARTPAAVIRPALALGLTGLLSSAQWMAPILIAGAILSPRDLGLVAACLRLVQGLNGILQLGLQALFPLVAGRPKGEAVLALTAQTTLSALGAVLVLAAIADPLVPSLLGPAFQDACPLFRRLLPVLVPVALASPAAYALMGAGENRACLTVAIQSTALTIAACALAFWFLRSPVAVPAALHPAMWAQAVVTLWTAQRLNLLDRPGRPFWRLLDPWRLGRMLRDRPAPDQNPVPGASPPAGPG